MKTEARKMAEKMSKSKKEADIAELAREISRGGAKPKGIDPTIPDSYREMLMDREREAMFKKGESNRYAKGGSVKKKKASGYAKGGMAMCGASMPPAQKGKK